jgi:hypothetical protein
MIFEFEYMDVQNHWQSMGEAEGTGGDAVGEALYALAGNHGDGLPAGMYRVRPVGTERWGVLTLNHDNTFEMGT